MTELEGVLLFAPKDDKDLKKTYSELSNIKEFDELSSKELLFSWHHSCPTGSQSNNKDERQRIVKSLIAAYGGREYVPDSVLTPYSEGNIPTKVRIAMERMAKFQVAPRLIAKRMVEKMFINFDKMVSIDVEEDFRRPVDNTFDGSEMADHLSGKTPQVPQEIKEWDFGAMKQYTDTCAKISETMPTLLRQYEEGFGITEGKKGESRQSSAIDKFHQNK